MHQHPASHSNPCARSAAIPQVFGLHATADISYYTSAAKALWAGLVDLQPRVGGGGGEQSREDLVSGVARDIRGRLPAPFDVPLIRKAIGVPSPTQVKPCAAGCLL